MSEIQAPPADSPNRRVQRVRHELKRREVTVAAVARPSENFARITFAGPALDDFTSLSFDDHVKFMFEAGGETVRRDYTPRAFDRQRNELVIEFVLHGHGPASEWARAAHVGQAAVIGGPRGSMVVPTDYDWHLLAGDASALPAIHRRLEELPAATRALVVVHADVADRRTVDSAARVDLQWQDDANGWLGALRALALPAGEGFVWCAGEAAVVAQARQIVLHDKQHPLEQAKLAAYWKRGSADYHDS